jgi:long-chain acyl-CoA synthetase
MQIIEASNIPELFLWRASLNPEGVSILVKQDGEFHPITWKQLRDDVWRACDVLTQKGVGLGDRVVLVANNRYEWLVVDLAILSLGAVHVPLHATLSPTQQLDQIADSRPCCLIVETDALSGLPDLPTIYLEASSSEKDCWSDLMQKADPDRGASAVEKVVGSLGTENLATILYTSGTTGDSKGVMLSHGNVASNAIATADVFQLGEDKVRLTFLPFSHIFARGCDIYGWLAGGCQLALAESKETVLSDCQAVSPHFIAGVPYFFERVMRGLVSAGLQNTPGILKKSMGGRIELCCSGGAPLADETYDYFASQGIPLLQGYGLTETSPVISMNYPGNEKKGSVGSLLKGVEVRIEPDGEISAKGPNVMQGYWQKPEATSQVLTEDGWFHTGDLGKLDEDGFLWITGRKKELIVTAGGKNVAPVLIESLLNQDPLISQSLVIGDRRKYLAALIVPDLQHLHEKLHAHGLDEEAWQSGSVHPAVEQWFEEAIKQRLANLSHYEQVQKFSLLPSPFTIESGELTAKLSMRRNVIIEKHQKLIDAMYGM